MTALLTVPVLPEIGPAPSIPTPVPPTKAQQQWLIDECWADFNKQVYAIAHSHQRRYGGDWEEIKGLAHEAFIDAYHKHNPAKAQFSTYLWHYVKGYLLSYQDERCKEAARVEKHKDRALAVARMAQPQEFNPEGLLARLSTEARQVMELVLHMPTEMAEEIKDAITAEIARRGEEREDQMYGATWRSSVKAYFAGMGWEPKQVQAAFEEIRAAL